METKALYTDKDRDRVHTLPDAPDFENHYERDFSFDLSNLIHTASFRRLAGKTQLLPELENEYFRNRLTHSLEVSDIAVKIAKKINYDHAYFKDTNAININLIRFAAHAHDLGHPPFGHKGERALDSLMRKYAKIYKQSLLIDKEVDSTEIIKNYGLRFEGNAFNIRLLTSLEKRYRIVDDSIAYYIGINPTCRSIASILKYDQLLSDEKIEIEKNKIKFIESKITKKGYFIEESELIKKVKYAVTGIENYSGKFRTLECNIMEFADDISYTVYDLDDVLKGRFISILDLTERLVNTENNEVLNNLHNQVKDDVAKAIEYNSLIDKNEFSFASSDEFLNAVINEFLSVFLIDDAAKNYSSNTNLAYTLTRSLQKDGNYRYIFTNLLINYFINAIKVIEIADIPALTVVKMDTKAFVLMSFLKHFIYYTITNTSKIQIVDYRGEEIVTTIFDTLYTHPNLLPDDVKDKFDIFSNHRNQKILNPYQLRCICDYVASMTNRYAIEFYARLKSENHQSIFKPF